jgi:hypothetical protein
MCEAVGLQRVKALVIEQGLDLALAGRIAVRDRGKIGPEGGGNAFVALQNAVKV